MDVYGAQPRLLHEAASRGGRHTGDERPQAHPQPRRRHLRGRHLRGAHDTLIAACDNPRYALLRVIEYHDNCADNLTASLAELGEKKPANPSPLNLFMHIPWIPEGVLLWGEPVSQPGSHVT